MVITCRLVYWIHEDTIKFFRLNIWKYEWDIFSSQFMNVQNYGKKVGVSIYQNFDEWFWSYQLETICQSSGSCLIKYASIDWKNWVGLRVEFLDPSLNIFQDMEKIKSTQLTSVILKSRSSLMSLASIFHEDMTNLMQH